MEAAFCLNAMDSGGNYQVPRDGTAECGRLLHRVEFYLDAIAIGQFGASYHLGSENFQ